MIYRWESIVIWVIWMGCKSQDRGRGRGKINLLTALTCVMKQILGRLRRRRNTKIFWSTGLQRTWQWLQTSFKLDFHPQSHPASDNKPVKGYLSCSFYSVRVSSIDNKITPHSNLQPHTCWRIHIRSAYGVLTPIRRLWGKDATIVNLWRIYRCKHFKGDSTFFPMIPRQRLRWRRNIFKGKKDWRRRLDD